MKETIKSLKEQMARKDAEIDSLKAQVKILEEFGALWKRIAEGQRPSTIQILPQPSPIINPLPYNPYPWQTTWTCGTGNKSGDSQGRLIC